MRLFTTRDKAALEAKIYELATQVAELQDRMSVVDGRSSLNAERNVRTHSSLQNLAEDFDPVARRVRLLMTERTQARQSDNEEE